MSLKLRVGVIIIVIFLILGGANFCILKFIILPGFLDLEREEAVKDVRRVDQAIKNELTHLESLAQDWATWDDTYFFIDSHDDDYIRTNLPIDIFGDLNLNLIYICDTGGRVIWGKIYDSDSETALAISEFPRGRLPENNPLLHHATETSIHDEINISGLYQTRIGTMAISSCPIVKTDSTGPIKGSLIMGYFINSEVAKKLSRQTNVNLTFSEIRAGNDISDLDLKDLFTGKKEYLVEEGPAVEKVKISTLLNDIRGQPILLLTAEIDRKIMERGFQTVLFSATSFLVTVSTALLVMLLLIQRGVLKPISQLTEKIISSRGDADEYDFFYTDRKDEIGILSREFANILNQLSKHSMQLEGLNAVLIEDLEKRKKIENALRESEDRFKTLLENIPGGVFVHDLDGQLLLVNDLACEYTGYTREELLNSNLERINPATSTNAEHKRLWKKIAVGNSVVIETDNVRKDGSHFPVEVHLTKIILEGEQIVMALVFDMTERKQAQQALRSSEEKLARSNKMESLGLLAGGVAHDLNNVLSGIVSYPEVILMDIPEDSDLAGPLKTIHESGKRAVAIVQDLLTVARGVAVEKQVLNLNLVVAGYLKSAEHKKLLQYHEDITIIKELDPGLMNIKGSPIHIGKTLMNLVSNAAEALGDNGVILIKTENRYLDVAIKGYEDVTVGEYAVLLVKDNGTGIHKEDLERIFEPFYTKKVMGRSGTGLGLSIVWSAIQEHKGYINVSSDNNGTVFELYFPITREDLPKEKSRKLIAEYSGNGEKILVIDDVESQREIICRMLQKLGYQAEAVAGGEAAIEYMKTKEVDLLILDMIMEPGINGKKTYEEILKIRPGQKAVIVSGYAETDDLRETQRLGAGKYLKKPVQIEKLGVAIKEELKRELPPNTSPP